jgi:hypothetical protein
MFNVSNIHMSLQTQRNCNQLDGIYGINVLKIILH